MNNTDLIHLIKTLSHFVRTDSNTFLWAKSQQNFTHEKTENENSIYDMGGGNFYIALSSLSFYGFVAKVFEIIETDNCQKLQKLFKKDKEGKPKNVYADETKAVKILTEKVNNEYYFIDNVDNIENFWKLMRHGLAHCYLPKGGRSTLQSIGHLDFKKNLNYYDYIYLLNTLTNPAVCSNNRDGFDVNSDLLAVKVAKISEWLIDYIHDHPLNENQFKYIEFLLEVQ